MNDLKTGTQEEGTRARDEDTSYDRMINPLETASNNAVGSNWIQSIIPNPAKDKVTIDFAEQLPFDAELQLTDYTGRIIKIATLLRNSKQVILDIETLAKGIYNVQLFMSNIPKQVKQFSKL